MSPTLSAANRNASFAGLPPSSDRASLLPNAPTRRLLELTRGRSDDRASALPAPAHSTRPSFPDRPSALNASQAFGVVTCGLLLAAIVAALIVSLG